jgi:hypothetical protein
MKITLSTNQAIAKIMADRYASWTYDQANAIVEYFELLEMDFNESIEMDVTAIRCEFDAYASLKELNSALDTTFKDIFDIDATVIECNDGTLLISNER